MTDRTDAEYIADDMCPVCKIPRRCKRSSPRRALIEHMRTRRDAPHALWRAAWWSAHFSRGGSAPSGPRALSDDDIRSAIFRAFGHLPSGILGTSAP